jgi:hypothetical protein
VIFLYDKEFIMESKRQTDIPISLIRPFGSSVNLYDAHISQQMTRELYKPSFTFSCTDTHVGIEVEVEGILTRDRVGAIRDDSKTIVGYLWSNTEDGSLRNNGREFVSIPVVGDGIVYAVDKLETYLNKNKSCVGHEFSERTSVHIHVNARDMTLEQLANFILLYTAVEPVLYNFCGGNRHKNIFCVPLNQTSEDLSLYSFYNKVKAQDRASSILDSLRHWKKYCGFNVRPLFSYGTIEFRHMVGTMNTEKLLIWIDMILKLKKYAMNSNFTSLYEELPLLNTTSEYSRLIYDIFGTYSEYLMFSNIQSRMEESVMFIKSCFSPLPQDRSSEIFSVLCKDNNANALIKSAIALNLVHEIKPRTKRQPVKVIVDEFAMQANQLDFNLALERAQQEVRDNPRWAVVRPVNLQEEDF